MLQHTVYMSGNGFQQRVGMLRASAFQRAVARNHQRRARDDSASKRFREDKILKCFNFSTIEISMDFRYFCIFEDIFESDGLCC